MLKLKGEFRAAKGLKEEVRLPTSYICEGKPLLKGISFKPHASTFQVYPS